MTVSAAPTVCPEPVVPLLTLIILLNLPKIFNGLKTFKTVTVSSLISISVFGLKNSGTLETGRSVAIPPTDSNGTFSVKLKSSIGTPIDLSPAN